VVIDEAHELFAGIYRRYDRLGGYKDESREALIAQRVREAIGSAPVRRWGRRPPWGSTNRPW
jgi:hypothetical protein